MKNILTFFIVSIFLLSFTSAFGERLTITPDLKDSLISKGVEISDTAMEYPAVEITGFFDGVLWIEDKKADIVLTQHDAECGIDCISKWHETLYSKGALVDKLDFYRTDLGERELRGIRSYQLQYYGDVIDYKTECSPAKLTEEEIKNETKPYDVCIQVENGSHKDWVNFNVGDILPAGEYDIQLLGQKAPYMSIDFVPTIANKEISEWATWGNISTGSQAEVRLNSPSTGSTQYYRNITTNASANVTGGAYLVNATLYDNSTGSWGARNTSNLTVLGTINTTLGNHSGTSGQYGTTIYEDGSVSINNKNVTRLMVDLYLLAGNTNSISENYWINFTYTDDTVGKSNVIGIGASGGNPTNSYDQNFTNPTDKLVKTIKFYTQTTGANTGTMRDVAFRNTELIGYDYLNTTYTKTYTNTYSSGSNIKWNYQFCDSDGACGFATSNYTFTIDSTAPTITLNYPTSLISYGAVNGTLQLNLTATDNNLASVWYDYNGTNVTVTGAVSGVANLSNITLSTKKNVTIYANDTAGNLNATTFSWDYRVFENSRTHNTTSYETAYENYQVNLTANSSLTAVYLNFNGTEFQTVNTNDGIWEYSRDLPTTSLGNNSISYRFVYAGSNITSSNTYQNVLSTIFQICNATYPVQFINFTFKDENALTNMNATMQTASWTYYLGSGTVTKSYIYTTSGNSSNYTFCATPNRTLYANPSITYLYTNYPARFYTPGTLTLSNTTTSTVLYLLSATDGIYVTFVTMGEANIALSGSLITITRTILGSLVTLAQGTTDSAGSYTVWLNPNYDHTITASKTGYGSNTQTIKPTQSSYTLILSSGANYSYVSNVNGLLWSYFPRERLNTTATNFGFNISSQYSSLIKCKIELLNNNKTSILSTAEQTTSNGSFCSVQTTYVPSSSEPKIKGRLLVDIGDGYQILEEDAYWVLISYNSTGMTITDWFNGLTDADLRYFNQDTQHREYTYILLFFLIVMIICATLNNAGWDIQTGGGMIFLVGTLVWVASVPGFLTLSGISPYIIIDKYFVAVIYSMFMIGFGARSLS